MDLVIIDCQNDFVDGILAAENGCEAVENIVDFLNVKKEDLRVFYTMDFHPVNHCSFKEQDGIWPPHCVAGTMGAELHDKFYETPFSPSLENKYYKGRNKDKEEYSAFEAENGLGHLLREDLGETIYLAGIASEYCVRETALDFKKAGKDVVVLEDLLGYINKKDHEENLESLEKEGVGVQSSSRC